MNADAEKALEHTYEGLAPVDVVMRDGLTLRAYECGPENAPPVVIINPIGVPIVISSKLARALGERWRVICWEQRGYRTDPDRYAATTRDFTVFVSDLVDVVGQRCRQPCAVIGICSGAAVAVRAVARGDVTASRLILVSPAIRFGDGYVPSIFDQALVPYMREISKGDQRLAKALLEIRAASFSQGARPGASIDEAIAELASASSLQSIERLVVYAKTVSIFTDERFDRDIANVRQRVAILCAKDDEFVSMQSARRLAQLLPLAELEELSDGGHYMIFLKAEARDRVLKLVDS